MFIGNITYVIIVLELNALIIITYNLKAMDKVWKSKAIDLRLRIKQEDS